MSRERQNGTKIYEVVLEATDAGAKVIPNEVQRQPAITVMLPDED